MSTAVELVAATCTDRYFIRCRDCLSIAAVLVDVPPMFVPDHQNEYARRHHAQREATHREAFAAQYLATLTCGLCRGKLDVMGRVRRDGRTMVTTSYDKIACDARCTAARGPTCDCPCKGENHGRDVTVPVVHVEGAPRVSVPDSAKARKVAAEWRAEVERVRGTLPGRLARIGAEGTYLPGSDYDLAQRFRAIFAHARGLKTHRGRMEALARIQERGIGLPTGAITG